MRVAGGRTAIGAGLIAGLLLTSQRVTSQVPSILVARVRMALAQGDLASAQALVSQSRRVSGDTPEMIEAYSWIPRAELAAGDLDQALKGAEEVAHLCEKALQGKKLDDDPHLPIALGASYEVKAEVMKQRHQQVEAVHMLEAAMRTWHGTSLVARLKKNLNLLTLEGKPMPALRETEWIGAKPPASLQGKVVLLFFWAHWCPDCKADAPAIAQLGSDLEGKGLVIVAPTKRYGYTADEDNVDASKEKAYIQRVFNVFYSKIPNVSVPIDAANFDRYGASTTPTIVVADRHGIVRLYHPGAMDEAELRNVIDPLLTVSAAHTR